MISSVLFVSTMGSAASDSLLLAVDGQAGGLAATILTLSCWAE
jgi:hypothetical protein